MKRVWSWLTPGHMAWLLMGLPFALATLYYSALAQDRYVSTAVLTVRRATQDPVATSGLAMLISGATGASQEDNRYLRDYLHSLGLLHKLDAQLQLRQHFESARADVFFRLWPHSSQEWWLDYWRSRVNITLDDLSGLLTIRVQGFDPETAQRINAALLSESEAFVNAISHRIAHEQLKFAQGELNLAGERHQAALGALLKFQTQHQMLDPMAQAQATGALASEMRAQLAKIEAELSAKRAYLQEDAPDVVTLKAQATALRLQVTRESRGATANTTGADGRSNPSLNKLAAEFQELKGRVSLANDAYRSALTAVETTRIEASRKVKSLVVIEPPTRPQTAEYPRRIYDLATLLLACFFLYAIARLTVATVNEHRD